MQKEVNEIINAKSKIEDSVVIFNIKNEKELCKLCYLGQSFSRVLLFIDSFKLEKISDVKRKTDFSFLKGKKIQVKCERIGEHGFSSMDIAKELSEHIFDKVKCSADFKNPEIIIYVYIFNENCHIGVDYAGFDLSKRDYKVYLHPEAMKGTTAYFMLCIGNYNKNMVLLDPFCGSGVIPIEAAYFSSGFPINAFRKEKFQFIKIGIVDEKFLQKFDKKIKFKGKIYGYDSQMRHINASKQNAKIGGVEKLINFSRVDVEWLDTKFKKAEIDLIVTDLPHITKWNEKKIRKIYDEFFYQAEFTLKKNGRIVSISNNDLKEAAKKQGFGLENEFTIQKKNQQLKIAVFKKEKI